MRKIEFRVWDKASRKMYKVQKGLFGAAGEGLFRIEGISFLPDHTVDTVDELNICDEDCTEPTPHGQLMQCTGLHDKNGKEIYEGDVLDCLLIQHDSYRLKHRVEFINGGFTINGYPITNYEEVEVIGNIYENPELTAKA